MPRPLRPQQSVVVESLEPRTLFDASPAAPALVARQTTTPITVDGKLNEPAWANAPTISTFYVLNANGQAAPDGATTAKILWDANYLYVGYQLADADIASAGLGHDGDLYQGDVAELFLKPSTSDTPYYEFEFSPNGDTFDAHFPTRFATTPDPRAYESGLTARTVVNGTDGNHSDTDTGWSVEVAIPRAALPAFGVGSQWTALVARYDYPTPPGSPLLTLSSPGATANGFHSYEIYNPLTFAGPVAGLSGTVFNDLNANGLAGHTEPALARWEVYVDLNRDGIFEPGEPITLTDRHGRYAFAGLSPARYAVRVIFPRHWHQTLPATQAYYLTRVRADQTTTGLNFGEIQSRARGT